MENSRGYVSPLWGQIIDELKENGRFHKSSVIEIPDDIWSYGKWALSLNETDLKKWFCSVVPAFFDKSPMEILKEDDGANELRNYMLRLP